MHRFHCDHCGNEVRFDSFTCPVCGSLLGYLPDELTVRRLHPVGDDVSYAVDGLPGARWRCANAAWGCNWLVATDSGAGWCRSCALTRGRPDVGRPDAIDAWQAAEAVKRRLVHQLDQLGLPVAARSAAVPNGLAFDFVHVPGERGLTGHLDGVVTIDLTEVDAAYRDQVRRQLGEPYRTIIGNLRHEIAHHYWHRLVGQSDELSRFRALFGHEDVDYAGALRRHYERDPAAAWDQRRFITRYAQAHPHEDWAESFAHYLHVVDLVDTAAAHGLVTDDVADRPEVAIAEATMVTILHRWRSIARAMDDVADAVGSPHAYPFVPTGPLVEKLEFIHTRVFGHTSRRRLDGARTGDDRAAAGA